MTLKTLLRLVAAGIVIGALAALAHADDTDTDASCMTTLSQIQSNANCCFAAPGQYDPSIMSMACDALKTEDADFKKCVSDEIKELKKGDTGSN